MHSALGSLASYEQSNRWLRSDLATHATLPTAALSPSQLYFCWPAPSSLLSDSSIVLLEGFIRPHSKTKSTWKLSSSSAKLSICDDREDPHRRSIYEVHYLILYTHCLLRVASSYLYLLLMRSILHVQTRHLQHRLAGPHKLCYGVPLAADKDI